MKKVILSVATLTLFTAASFAQDAAVAIATPVAEATAQGEDKKKVEESALPEAIKKTLSSDQYKEWKLVSAWHVTGKQEYYLLDMKKGDENTTLKMNKEGQVI